MAVRTVIFDWGGTLTPWHSVDHEALWHGVCVQHYPQAEAADLARAIYQAERAVWQGIEDSQQNATLAPVFEAARAAACSVAARPFDNVSGAKGIGMRAVLTGNSPVPPFEAAVPDATITRLAELPRYLDRW